MAKATSPASGQAYGIRRVCDAWGVPRSSFYAAKAPTPESAPPTALPARRGPKPAITDEALLAAIKRDLETSTWTGEGHRKVWARLRVRDGIRDSRKRLLRMMRENALLSPHRSRRRPDDAHQRQIITEAPDVMWAIDPLSQCRPARTCVLPAPHAPDGLTIALAPRRVSRDIRAPTPTCRIRERSSG
ncbi:hypothetical protein ACLF3G_26540 [Falsiroseomonas sp. HC035]|uniref:hypothetical protein n=1 Tax=Falsiroseomonas sp. HC035 TaxID=3390999 RepID=UPI003D313111